MSNKILRNADFFLGTAGNGKHRNFLKPKTKVLTVRPCTKPHSNFEVIKPGLSKYDT